jgi:hypothetical protein
VTAFELDLRRALLKLIEDAVACGAWLSPKCPDEEDINSIVMRVKKETKQ